VKILLGRDDVNPNTPDHRGQTPLSRATKNGNAGVVKILLGRDGVNPDKPNNKQAFQWASPGRKWADPTKPKPHEY